MSAKALVTLTAGFMIFWSFFPKGAGALDLKDEIELGREVFRKVQENYRFLNSPEVNFYVTELGNKLVKNAESIPYKYKFFVIDNDIPNAFTIPGGYVFVNTGLINLMTNEGELASVIAHEIAHAQARHIHRQLEQQKTLMVASLAAILAGALIGNPQLAQAITTGSIGGAQTVALSYSRDHEREADQIGLRILTTSGYSPYDALSAMQKLSQKQWQGRPGNYDYLMSHPGIAERIDYLSVVAKKLGSSSEKKSIGLFPYAKATILGITNDISGLDRIIRDAQQLNYDTPVVAYAQGIRALGMGSIYDAANYLETAWQTQRGNIFIATKLSEVLVRQRQYEKANSVFTQSLSLSRENPILHYRYGIILEENERFSEALEHYEKALSYSDFFIDIEYHLGTVLGKLGRLREAHTYLGDHYAKIGDQRLATFHYEKALSLASSQQDKDLIQRKLTNLKRRGEQDQPKERKF
ncbi:MAG: M48 family metalloprotease [Syntrophobacterales bacterium]|nr:M48 family metalloprotease [Syntrophobacterales bacterium]